MFFFARVLKESLKKSLGDFPGRTSELYKGPLIVFLEKSLVRNLKNFLKKCLDVLQENLKTTKIHWKDY